jgi:hypothetical protein
MLSSLKKGSEFNFGIGNRMYKVAAETSTQPLCVRVAVIVCESNGYNVRE